MGALTRLGEILKAAKDSERIREGRPKKNGSDVEPFPERETLADLGIDKKVSMAAPKATGGKPYQATGSVVEPVERAPTLADLGIDKKV